MAKGNDRLANRPARGGKNNNGLANRPQNYKRDRPMRGIEEEDTGNPPWLDAAAGALLGPIGTNPDVQNGVIGGLVGGGIPAWLRDKGNDQLAVHPVNMKTIDRLQMRNKNFNRLAPHLYGDGGSGFGSSYGSNWSRGYGGGGGGWDSGGWDDTPAWMRAYLRLNSWNI